MARITKAVEIDAPVERVFGFMTDPTNLPAIWPSMVSVSNVERSDGGASSFDWVYKMAGVRFDGHSEQTVEANRRVVARNSGIPSTFEYRYEPLGGAKTRVAMDVEYEVPAKRLGKLAGPLLRRMNEREAETLLHNLKARMEGGAEA